MNQERDRNRKLDALLAGSRLSGPRRDEILIWLLATRAT